MSAAVVRYMPMSGTESLHVAVLDLVAAALGGLAHFGCGGVVHNCIFLLLVTFLEFLGVKIKVANLELFFIFDCTCQIAKCY